MENLKRMRNTQKKSKTLKNKRKLINKEIFGEHLKPKFYKKSNDIIFKTCRKKIRYLVKVKNKKVHTNRSAIKENEKFNVQEGDTSDLSSQVENKNDGDNEQNDNATDQDNEAADKELNETEEKAKDGEIEEKAEEEDLEKPIIDKLEEYNHDYFPWPMKNKDIEILKIHGFPFESLGPHLKKMSKSKLEEPTSSKIVGEMMKAALDEAVVLFSKAGYEGEIIKWLFPLFKEVNKPPEPHEFLKRMSTKIVKEDQEYLQLLEELRCVLALENDYAFELAQIKMLCGMIDEETYAIDGTPREEWDKKDVSEEQKKNLKIKCVKEELMGVVYAMIEERKRLNVEKNLERVKKREQTLKDLQLWKTYVPPTMETLKREQNIIADDGRKRDWFEGLNLPVFEDFALPFHDDEQDQQGPSIEEA